MENFIFETRLGIFKRLIDTVAAGVILPAMVGASDAIRLDETVVELHAAMGAFFGDQAMVAALVAVQD